jgi:DNA-binding response OmpR family regulator
VFNADAKTMQRMAPLMQRVLIVNQLAAPARMLTDLLRDIAPCQVWTANDAARGLILAQRIDPHLVFVEQARDFDGIAFTKTLRRSEYSCRKSPVIMLTAEATASAIIAARDAGVHEFLRKPFTIRDLVRRIEAVTLRTRDWVEAVNYIGPDRRRFNSGDYTGPLKRRADNPATPDVARIIQALKIFKSAVGAIESDPSQALRAMLAQANELQIGARGISNPKLAAAAASVERALTGADPKQLKRQDLEGYLAELWNFMPSEADNVAASAAA